MNSHLQNAFQPARSLVSLAWRHHEAAASFAATALPGSGKASPAAEVAQWFASAPSSCSTYTARQSLLSFGLA